MTTTRSGAVSQHLKVRPDFLKLVREEAIDPELPIVDPHHHAWDHPGQSYLLNDILQDFGDGHNIVASVFVEAGAMYRAEGPAMLRPVGETEFAGGLAAMSASGDYGPARVCAGIVGALDVTLGSRVGAVLDEHMRAGGARLKGVRPRVVYHAEPGIVPIVTQPRMLASEAAHAAIAEVARRNLSLDIWALYTQMDEVMDICRAFPDLTVIVNHVAGPIGIGSYAGRRGEMFAEWSATVRTLAGFDNVRIKVGGLAMRYAGLVDADAAMPPTSDQLVARWRPFVETCIEAFGPSRAMFESNFPVDKCACSYQVLWNAFKKLTQGYAAAERGALFSATAARTYRLAI